MTRILWSSNGGHSCTGYATQTKAITKGIQALGYPIAVHAWWGLQGGPVTIDGILHYPQHLDSYGNDAAAYYCRKFKADLLITLIDLWVMDPQLGNMGNTRWVPYFPIDSDPIPAAIGERFKTAHRLLVYSRYAEKLVKEYDGGKYAERVRYIPHGVDCETLRPCTIEEKLAFRRKLYGDWPEDAYIVGMVAANKGWPSRKSFPEAMEAFAAFAANHPEARLYLHSYRASDFRGPELGEMAAHFGIADKVRFANPKMIIGGDYSDEQMREIFCSLDVLMSPSQGEGFGLPIIEAQSAGIPVIVTDHSAMSELVGDGYRVKPLRLQPTLLWAKMAEADPVGVHHALEECYRRPKSEHFSQIAREMALNYAWPKVLSEYWAPWLAEMDGGRRELALELVKTG